MIDNTNGAFFRLTEPLLSRDVTRGTMMGYACLRYQGAFFASEERGSGKLILKLPVTRVQEIVASGLGVPFAPNGRVFKEWVLVTAGDAQCRVFLAEALAFADHSAKGLRTASRQRLPSESTKR